MKSEIKEGNYQIELLGERFVVQVMMTMTGQWPSTRECLAAHFLSGPPRFPHSVEWLKNEGCNFSSL